MYDALINLRQAILEDMQEDFPAGFPLTVAHHELVEVRLQTMLMLAMGSLIKEVKSATEKKKEEKAKAAKK